MTFPRYEKTPYLAGLLPSLDLYLEGKNIVGLRFLPCDGLHFGIIRYLFSLKLLNN